MTLSFTEGRVLHLILVTNTNPDTDVFKKGVYVDQDQKVTHHINSKLQHPLPPGNRRVFYCRRCPGIGNLNLS